MEYALVFGVAVPVMLPALVVVIGIQCAVFHHAQASFSAVWLQKRLKPCCLKVLRRSL
jgi:hypothetical protein